MKIRRDDILLLYTDRRPERYFVGILNVRTSARAAGDEFDCIGSTVYVKYYDPERGIIAKSSWTKSWITIVEDVSALPGNLRTHVKEIVKELL